MTVVASSALRADILAEANKARARLMASLDDCKGGRTRRAIKRLVDDYDWLRVAAEKTAPATDTRLA